MTTGYFISLGFWALCMGLVALYWRRRIERERREWAAMREREWAEINARFEARRAAWDEENAVAKAEHAVLVAEIEAGFERANQYWIKRGMEPNPPEPSEPSP